MTIQPSREAEDRRVSRQEVLDVLGYYLEWSIAYVKAARRGDDAEMARLDKEFDPESVLRPLNK